jgi:peptide/nickel transport system substrate-binding protein
VDRPAFNDAVYLGAGAPAFGPVTSANRKWFDANLPRTPHDPARARELLSAIGLADRNGDGLAEDAQGRPARFSLLTQKGQTALERGSIVIRDELRKIGLQVDVSPLDRNAVVQRFLSGKGYDAAYFRVGTSDTDPALNPDYWFSSGGSHVWNLAQPTPATEWERRIDALMLAQSTSVDEAERKRLFDEVQRIYAEHVPVVHFVAPKVFVAASTRVRNLTPAISRPQLLWAADTLGVQ